jgi:hypothetical protein
VLPFADGAPQVTPDSLVRPTCELSLMAFFGCNFDWFLTGGACRPLSTPKQATRTLLPEASNVGMHLVLELT